MKNKYTKPILSLIIGIVIVALLFYAGGVVTALKNKSPIGEELAGVTSGALAGDTGSFFGGWLVWTIVGAIIVYIIYIRFSDPEYWKIGTREVVMMALGAALYGLLSLAFNTIPVPSVSLVALRPVVAIPVFFGMAFGPAVGFFTGAVGNILGDALTGWGVYPAWDIANGLMGLVPGLAAMYFTRKQKVNTRTLFIISAIVLIIAVLLPIVFPSIAHPWTGDATVEFGGWWWIMLVILIVTAVLALAPQYWSIVAVLLTLLMLVVGIINRSWLMIVWSLFQAVLVIFLFTRRKAITAWLSDEDTRRIVIWGTLGIIIGIGFAAFADIFINGYSFATAFVGEFIPAAGPNILFSAILTPLLYAAWQQARGRAGR